LGGSDEAEVGRDFLFAFTVLNCVLSLFDQPDHGFARLGLRLFSEKLEGGFQAVYMPFGLLKVFKEGFLELRMMGSVGQFRQGFHQLTFCMEKVAQFFDEQFF